MSSPNSNADYPPTTTTTISDIELISQNSKINNDDQPPSPLSSSPRRGSWKSVGHHRRRSSYKIMDNNDDNQSPDDCLIRLIKDACLAHCRKNDVKINDSNVLNILNEVIGDIKMIIMIDESNTTTPPNISNAIIDDHKPSIDMQQIVFSNSEAFIQFVDSLTANILDDCFQQFKPVIISTTFESENIIETPPCPIITDNDDIDEDDDERWWQRQMKRQTTELFIDNGSNQWHFIDLYQDLFHTMMDTNTDCLNWIQPFQSIINQPFEQQPSPSPPPIVDRSEFTECQVEVRQIGTSVKSTRQSRFLQRRRWISYAEINEYPLVLSIDFYYISGFVPQIDERCPIFEPTPSPRPPSRPDNDLCFDEYANDNDDGDDEAAEDPEILLQKLREQQQEYLERRRRSKHFWWEQHQSLNDDVGRNCIDNYNDDNLNQSTSDYHEEDDGEEYRENSYDHYLIDHDDDIDPNNQINDHHKVRFADQIDHVSFAASLSFIVLCD